MKCSNCDIEVDSSKKFCQNCGKPIRRDFSSDPSLKDLKSKKKKWPNKIALILGIWGFLNLLVASPIFAGVLILFAILIFASQSHKAIYAFGIIWLILALIQLIFGAFLLNSYYIYESNQGVILLILSFINFGFGGYTIYKTRKFEEY